MAMHSGTLISRAFAIAAWSSFIAPSMVSFSVGAVSAIMYSL